MKLFNKFLIVVFCLSVFSIFNQELSYSEQICAGYVPADRAAADRIAAYINYFTDGQASVVPPKLNDNGNYYGINIIQQPSGFTINEEAVNYLPKSIITNQAALRLAAEQQDVKFEVVWRNYIDTKLAEWTPDFSAVVNEKTDGFRAVLSSALNKLAGTQLDQQEYGDIISAYIEQIKSGFKPADMISLVQDYMVGLKDVVASYIKEATGEEFNLADVSHSGVLTYWSEWALSASAMFGKEEALKFASNKIQDRKSLVKKVNRELFNDKGDIFSPSFGRVLSYFADMMVYREGIDYGQIENKIDEFGKLFNSDKDLVLAEVKRLTGDDMNVAENLMIAEKFNVLYLSEIFDVFDGEAMDDFEAENGEPMYVDYVRYSRLFTADREDINAYYASPLEPNEVFADVVTQAAVAKIEQYVGDMIAINAKFLETFKQSYDTTTVAGVDNLLNRAFVVDVIAEGYMREDISASDAHNKALTQVLDGIGNMEEFPELSYLEGNTFARDDNDIPTLPISEPCAVGNFNSTFL